MVEEAVVVVVTETEEIVHLVIQMPLHANPANPVNPASPATKTKIVLKLLKAAKADVPTTTDPDRPKRVVKITTERIEPITMKTNQSLRSSQAETTRGLSREVTKLEEATTVSLESSRTERIGLLVAVVILMRNTPKGKVMKDQDIPEVNDQDTLERS